MMTDCASVCKPEANSGISAAAATVARRRRGIVNSTYIECGSGIANHRNAIGNQATRKTPHPPSSKVTPAIAPTIESAWGYAIRNHHALRK